MSHHQMEDLAYKLSQYPDQSTSHIMKLQNEINDLKQNSSDFVSLSQ